MYKKSEAEEVKIDIPFDPEKWDTYHTGIYFKEEKKTEVALEYTLARMVRLMPSVKKSSKILVFAGDNSYPVVFLGAKYGSKIECIAYTEEGSKSVAKDIKAHGIEDKITMHIQTLEKTMFSDANFDIIISLDDLHKTEDKKKAIREAARLLVPEGRFIFCDYFKKGSESTKDGKSYMTSKEYLHLADRADLERVYFRDMAADAIKHHDMVISQIGKKSKTTSVDELTTRKTELEEGRLDWGFFQFQKRNV